MEDPECGRIDEGRYGEAEECRVKLRELFHAHTQMQEMRAAQDYQVGHTATPAL